MGTPEALYRLPESDGNYAVAQLFSDTFSLIEGKRVTPVPSTRSGIHVHNGVEQANIYYSHPVEFFRGLLDLASHPDAEEFHEMRHVDEVAVSKDDARGNESGGGTYRIDYIDEQILPRLAMLGMTQIFWYIENPLSINDQVDRKKLRELVEGAKENFGIEIIPATQFYSHANRMLEKYPHLGQNPHSFDANNPKVYDFFERELIPDTVELFGGHTIHIGFDEAIKHGGVDNNSFIPHLLRTGDLLTANGLKGIIWADELFNFTHEELQRLFDKFQPAIMHWDYETEDEEKLKQELVYLQQFGVPVYSVSGVLDMNRFDAHYDKAEPNIGAHSTAAIEARAHGMLVSSWGDGSHKASLWGDLYGFALNAEYAYNGTVDHDAFAAKYFALTGEHRDEVVEAGMMDSLYEKKGREESVSNIAQTLFFEDPLTHPFSGSAPEISFSEKYEAHYHRLLRSVRTSPQMSRLSRERQIALANVLRVKADLGNKSAFAYTMDDKDGLKRAIEDSSTTIERVLRLKEAHETEWLNEKNPAGFQKIAGRYDDLIRRLEFMRDRRLTPYMSGEIERIPEFEQIPDLKNRTFLSESLWYDQIVSPKTTTGFSLLGQLAA